MSRAVMQQALEALELCRQADMRTSTLLHADDAIEALRTALAEPKPEPVAWINVTDRTCEWARPIQWNTSTTGVYDKIPLFATTPQRKPLTEEQMLDLISAEGGNGLRTPLASAITLIRAVERAHGIE